MAIADTTLLLEGQRDFSGGMNSSVVPTLVPDDAVHMAVNVTFRGGTPATRPGLSQVILNNAESTSFSAGGLDDFVNGFMQGAFFYRATTDDLSPSLFCVVSGYVIRIDLSDYTVHRLYSVTAGGTGNNTFRLNSTVEKVYFVQAEKYLIIQNGVDTPVIWDGEKLYVSGVGPTNSTGSLSELHTITGTYGTAMAYGQGRLFVADKDRTSIFAGDLVYGGSTNQLPIASAEGISTTHTHVFFPTASPAVVQVGNDIKVGTTVYFSTGDYITITGLSSSQTTNESINGTWKIEKVGTSGGKAYISIAAVIQNTASASPATGGYVTKANSGEVSDLLKFTETTYLNEGGSFQVPSFMGKITGLIFMPVQDTGTGQGDLLVFCETGVLSLAVSVPRTEWKQTSGFQRVALADNGATSYESLTPVNGDIFFRSLDGLRTYRNARAELNAYGQVPISAEMNSVLPYDTKSMLNVCSSILFDNRLLFTASPKVDYSGVNVGASVKRPVTFSSIVALDFTTLSTIGAKRSASYDGLWKGLDVTRLVAGRIKEITVAYAFAVDYPNDAANALWQITTDLYADKPANSSYVPISSILETRTFNLGSPSEVKKLIRSDFWISQLRGSTNFSVYWRPDEYPCWRTWHEFTRCAQVDNCVITGVGTEYNELTHTTTLGFSNSAIRWYRVAAGATITEPVQFVENLNALADAAVLSAALSAAAIPHSSVVRTGTYPSYVYVVSGTFSDFAVFPVQDPGTSACEPMFRPKNFQPQYRPQIRMPTPPEESDPIVGRPYYFGNDFQIRIEWVGHCRLSRILVLGQRQLEQYQGTDYVEVV